MLSILTPGEMVAECSVMRHTGSQTTGISLSILICLLVAHPQVADKLREEVDQVLVDIPDT